MQSTQTTMRQKHRKGVSSNDEQAQKTFDLITGPTHRGIPSWISPSVDAGAWGRASGKPNLARRPVPNPCESEEHASNLEEAQRQNKEDDKAQAQPDARQTPDVILRDMNVREVSGNWRARMTLKCNPDQMKLIEAGQLECACTHMYHTFELQCTHKFCLNTTICCVVKD